MAHPGVRAVEPANQTTALSLIPDANRRAHVGKIFDLWRAMRLVWLMAYVYYIVYKSVRQCCSICGKKKKKNLLSSGTRSRRASAARRAPEATNRGRAAGAGRSWGPPQVQPEV